MITVEENERAHKAIDVITGRELLRLASTAIVDTVMDSMLDNDVRGSVAADILWKYAGKLDKALADYEAEA